MSYPDLLFLQPPTGKLIPACVYEDMKLDSMLTPVAVEVMRRVCGREDILARQSMFRALSRTAFRTHMQRLSEDMTLLRALSGRYEESRCEEERWALYVNLSDALCAFFKRAAQAVSDAPEEENPLYGRFQSYFAGRVELENYKRIRKDIDALLPRLESVLHNTCRIEGDEVTLLADRPQTYLERLLRCAEELQLPDASPQKMAPRPIDASLIRALAALYPEVFAALGQFYRSHRNFYEGEILRYGEALEFYLTLAALLDRAAEAGIPIRYPVIAGEKKIELHAAYDVTLLTKGEKHIIPNDALFDEKEPFFYLTGANGGGKTTYLRTVGIQVLLFLAGSPLPCEHAEIYTLGGVYTHFPRDERFNNAGRGVEEQMRVDEMLSQCGADGLVLLNETYSTTSEETAIERTVRLADRLYASGCFGVFVTHMHGVGETEIPYLNVLIDRSDSNRRTYKVARQRSAYSSYANDILQKYGLTREALEARFGGAKKEEQSE